MLFPTPWTAACLTVFPPLSPGVYPSSCPLNWWYLSNHLILSKPVLLLPSVFPSIRIFSNESALHIRWPNYWSFSLSISLPMSIHSWFPLRGIGLISLLSKRLSRVFSSTTVRNHQFFFRNQFFVTLPSLLSSSHSSTWLPERPQLSFDSRDLCQLSDVFPVNTLSLS